MTDDERAAVRRFVRAADVTLALSVVVAFVLGYLMGAA